MQPAGPLIHIPKQHEVRVHQDGTKVVFQLDGRLVFSAEWAQALRVGQSIVQAALAARAVDPRPRPQRLGA